MRWILCIVLGLLLLPLILLDKRRTRRARTQANLLIKSSRGITEERYVRIGGIDQWVGIRSEDRDNPALLILHGGPGCPYSIFTPHLRTWEKHFTVLQWDQRGSGKTFRRMGKGGSEPISFEQLTTDAIAVAEYARMRLDKKRLFLLASSLGSTFGMRLARRRPDLFYAYIGTDQNVGMKRERDARHNELLERLRTRGLSEGLKVVQQIGPDPTHWTVEDFEAIARWTMRSDVQGFQRTMNLLKNAVWYAPNWTLKDIRAFAAGMHYSLQKLLPEIVQYDAWDDGAHFEIPFFIFQGEADVLTTPKLAQSFFDDVTAPMKRFALIADAGHFAAFLQPERFLRQLLIDVQPLSDHIRGGPIV